MAAPDAPASVTVSPGLNPESVKLACALTTGATTYDFYWSNATGVSKTVYKGHKKSVHNYLYVEGLNYRKVFATATGTNVGGEESDAATESSGFAGQ